MPKVNARYVDNPVPRGLFRGGCGSFEIHSEDAVDGRIIPPAVPLFRVLPGLPGSIHGEFDPGSGRTLAACLTHASRTVKPFGVDQWRTGE